MFKLFRKKREIVKHEYFGGFDLPISDIDGFLNTQGIEENNVPRLSDYIVLSYDDKDLLADINQYSNKKINDEWRNNRSKDIESLIDKVKYKDNPKNIIIDLIKYKKGLHQIGGIKPDNFKLQKTKNIGNFQYLGYINNEDEKLSWLNIKLHLTCPIFLNFKQLFLDYSNPLSPQVINIDELNSCETSYDFLDYEFQIHYKEYKCRYEGAFDYGYGIAHSGIPNWIQNPMYPRCPKTNKIMKFVCQIKSTSGIMVDNTNVSIKDKFMKSYFKKLNFWGDGDLFVFFEPTSKTACYFIQKT